jgi:hypothetical protein
VYDVSMPTGGRVVGTASDAESGVPVYGAQVIAVPAAGGDAIAASTGRDGSYDLRGLPAGWWVLSAEYQPWCRDDPNWATVWYTDAPGPGLAVIVQVDGGETLAWSPRMHHDDDQDGMSDAWEEQYGLDSSRDDSGDDPDGDGSTNLEEYRTRRDPMAAPGRCGRGDRSALLPGGLALVLLLGRRLARRRPAAQAG